MIYYQRNNTAPHRAYMYVYTHTQPPAANSSNTDTQTTTATTVGTTNEHNNTPTVHKPQSATAATRTQTHKRRTTATTTKKTYRSGRGGLCFVPAAPVQRRSRRAFQTGRGRPDRSAHPSIHPSIGSSTNQSFVHIHLFHTYIRTPTHPRVSFTLGCLFLFLRMGRRSVVGPVVQVQGDVTSYTYAYMII